MNDRKTRSDKSLGRRHTRTLANIGLRLMGSEGKVGRLRRHYLEAAAGQTGTVIVQVGANDGVFDDPLYPFFKGHPHVRGILIEPQEHPYEQLSRLYQDNPNIVCVRTAIAKDPGTLTLWSVDLGQDPFGKVIARANPEKLPYVMWRRPGKRLKGYQLEQEIVPAMPLIDVLEKVSVHPQQVSAFFTDTEGHDIEVVHQLLDSGARPIIIQYEHVIADDQSVLEANKRLSEIGYDLSWSFRDIFAVLRT
jgi:FkbM family methyltransferase